MTLPIENYLAAFPPVRTVRMGWLRRPVVLGPLTLGAAVMLDALGVNPCGTVAEKDAAIAAYVLSGGGGSEGRGRSGGSTSSTLSTYSTSFHLFERRVKRRLKDLCKAVNETLHDGMATYVKPAPDKNAVTSTTPHGVGWWLSYAEALCDDYGWTWEVALKTPLATVFALVTAHRERYRIDHGDSDYVERAYIALKKARGEW